MILCVLTTLGEMSPHRQFTHKWFGTSLFCITAYFAFENKIAIVAKNDEVIAAKPFLSIVKTFLTLTPLNSFKFSTF